MAHSNSSIPIILLAFANNAEVPLRELAYEQDELNEVLHQVHDARRCQVFIIAAASPEKIINIFQRYPGRIRIFHYGGHSNEESLFLQKDFPDQQHTNAVYLAEFLGVQEGLELVFINGCLSSGQAEAYQQEGAKAVIATGSKIEDEAAREFARYFYQALAGGSSISEAFRSAESGYKTKHGGLPRGIGIQEEKSDFSWKLFPKGPHHWQLPPADRVIETQGPRFVTLRRPARQDKLLQRLLVLSDIQIALAKEEVLWLHGTSGCGKTILAEQYYHLFQSEYQHLAWIEVKQDFLQDFIAAAPDEVPISKIRARLQEQDRRRPDIDLACANAFSRFLAHLPGKVLMVIDGIKDVSELIPYYELLQLNRGHVLITSYHSPASNSDFDRRYRYGAMTAPAFTDEEIQLLAGQHEQDYPWAQEILDHLRGHALLMSILFKNVSRSKPAVVDQQLHALIRQAPSGNIDQSLLTLLFRQFPLALAERWLLLQWAALPEGFYEPDFVAHLIGIEEVKQPISTQAYRNFKGKDKRLFRWKKSKDSRFLDLLEQLLERGWLVANEENRLSLHSAVVPVLQAELSPRLDFFVELSENLQEVFFLHEEIGVEDAEEIEIDDRLWMRSNVQYENHLRSLTDLILEEGSEEFLGLLNKLISILEANIKLAEELRLREQYVSILKTREAGNSSRLAVALGNLAGCFDRNGKYKEALGYYQKAQAIFESVLEVNHRSLATSYNNIAIASLATSYNNTATAYLALGQYEQALGYVRKALSIRESVLEANHPELASSYHSLAAAYHGLGLYEQALGNYQKALAIRESVLRANHLDLATSYNSVAITYSDLGQYEQALGYHQKSQAILESVLGANHPDLAGSYNNVATTYRGLGQYEQALDYLQKTLVILESVLETNHPLLAISYQNIAETYHALGQHVQALGYHQKALAILGLVLEADHSDRAISYNNIANTYRALGQYEQALDYYQKAQVIFESVLEANHPLLATSYHNLAGIYRVLGQYEQALGYGQKAQAILESVLEANHPDLANSYNNIGKTYRALGQYEQVLAYLQKALTIRESVLAANHPDLATSYHNIALTYRDLGQKDKAEEYEAKATAIQKKRNE